MNVRPYRGFRVYSYIALSRLFYALNLDLEQEDLLDRAPERIQAPHERISKGEILHAVRSNSYMTDKVLRYLVAQGHATIVKDAQGYDVRITVSGVEHLRRFHALYQSMYSEELNGHYRYAGPPPWLR
ncbi:MAG: hypothetical protein L3K15_09490 [Thermoplasmata archaeon]|nr:hypothetical protein [Thermoplasmata archaeon]